MSQSPEKVSCLIVGSGPAGYTAAIYAARADLKPMMYMGPEPGGQLTTTTEVENYPGFPHGVQGPEMMELFKAQAERFKTDIRFGWATKVDFSGPVHKVWIDDKIEIHADTVIVATGASAKWLGLPSEQKYRSIGGVSACAVCDGFFYRGKDVAIVGGLEVLRYMQHEPELSNIPVIVVSAKSMPGDIKTGLEAGASLYLTKPVSFLDLKQAVEQVIQKA